LLGSKGLAMVLMLGVLMLNNIYHFHLDIHILTKVSNSIVYSFE